MKNNTSYLKTDDNRIINEKAIVWVKKIDECLEVCLKSTGCMDRKIDTHRICQLNNPKSYDKLINLFN